MERPTFLTREILLTVEHLSDAKKDNIIEIIPRLLSFYPALSSFQAQQVLLYWNHVATEKVQVLT